MTTDPEELLDALDDAEVIGTVTDAMGDYVKVGVLRRAALIGVSGSPAILDTRERRAEFDGYWGEACRRAEAAGAGEEAQSPRRTVTLDITGPDAYHALTQALEDFAARERDAAEHEGGNESRERWADLADRMREQAEAAG